MNNKFQNIRETFYNQYNNTIEELESMMIEMLKNNNNLIEIEIGVTCNAPNYDDEWDDPFILVTKVKLDTLEDGEAIGFYDDDENYSVEIGDISIETLFVIVEEMLKQIN
jgi:hypothetical protein